MQLSSSSLPLASAMSSLRSHVILSHLLIAVKEASVCEAVWLLFAVTHVCVSHIFGNQKKHPLLYKISCLPRVIIACPVLMQLHQVSHSGA